jgi:hypothetical protein
MQRKSDRCEGKKNAYSIAVRRPYKKRPLGTPRNGREITLKKTAYI